MIKKFILLIMALIIFLFSSVGQVEAFNSGLIVTPSTIEGESIDVRNLEVLLDGDATTQPEIQKGLQNSIDFYFTDGINPSMIKLYLLVKTDNIYNLELLTASGVWMSVPGASNLRGNQLRVGWNRFPITVTGQVKQVRLRIERADERSQVGVSEVEFWGQTRYELAGEVKEYVTEEDLTLDFSQGQANSDAKQTVHINISKPISTIEKAELVYDISNLRSYTDGFWEINNGGEHYLLGQISGNNWATMVEEIDPAILIEGRNTINFKVSDTRKSGLKVKNIRLRISFSTGQSVISSIEGAGINEDLLSNLYDGDIDTVWQTDWRIYDQVSFIVHLKEKTEIEYLNWLQDKNFLDGVRVEYWSTDGWRLFGRELNRNELIAGWNLLETDGQIETEKLRFTLLNPQHKQMIGPLKEIGVWGSIVKPTKEQTEIVLVTPKKGEVVSDKFLLRAFVKGKYDQILINDRPVELGNKGRNQYIEQEIKYGELAQVTGKKSITIQAYDTGNLVASENLVITSGVIPVVNITTPASGYLTNAAETTVVGTVQPYGDELYINGRKFAAGVSSFSVLQALGEGLNKLTVLAKNGDGSTGEKSIYVHRDSTPPIIHLDGESANIQLTTDQKEYQFTGYVEEYSNCKLFVGSTEIPLQYGAFFYTTPVVAGRNTITFRAVDQLNQESTITASVMLDTTEPAPFTPTLSTTGWASGKGIKVNFTTTDLESGINHYEVKVDMGGYVVAVSPYTLPDLADGAHVVYVKAVNAVGLSRVATVQVNVDAVAPVAFTPVANPAGWSQNARPVISFATTDISSGINHYELKVDSGPFVVATSPYTLSTQGEGTHTITVKAVDNVGLSTLGTVQIKVDLTAPAAFTPTIDSTGLTNNNQPGISFATTDVMSGIDHYEMIIDGYNLGTVSSPFIPQVLGEGVHQIKVRAFDRVGFSSSGTVQITIDTIAPATPLNYKAISEGTQITLQWTAGSETDLAKYRLHRSPAWSDGDVKEFVAPTTVNYLDSELIVGNTYTYYLEACDTAGNISRPTESAKRKAGVSEVVITPGTGGTANYGNEV